MKNRIDNMLAMATQSIASAQDIIELEHLRTQYLGKKGQLTEVLKILGTLPPAERSAMGSVINAAKQEVIKALEERGAELNQLALNHKLQTETIDVSLPGRFPQGFGSIHPITRVRERLEKLYLSAGFQLVEGPEIEDDYHNFAALNFPLDHPARAMHDTFYFENGALLRTHTSTVQIRIMESTKPPLRVITPGRVYRCDSDQTHTPMFHQLEGLVVDEGCTFADLKGHLKEFMIQFFERDLAVRFRASYFPFTEPSAEMDVSCLCAGSGCRVCGGTGWLEVLGCGMVHPHVLSMCGVDAEKYTGFAFGIGMDRLAMLRYGIDDLRKFFENDVRFLSRFTSIL